MVRWKRCLRFLDPSSLSLLAANLLGWTRRRIKVGRVDFFLGVRIRGLGFAMRLEPKRGLEETRNQKVTETKTICMRDNTGDDVAADFRDSGTKHKHTRQLSRYYINNGMQGEPHT